MNNFLGRPPGAEEQKFTPAIHTQHERSQRVQDVLYDVDFFVKEAEARDEPLEMTLERNVKAPASNELQSILHACLDAKGVRVKSGFGRSSTSTEDVVQDETSRILTNAYLTSKTFGDMFGGIKRRKMRAASTRDAVPSDSLANPSLREPLKDDERKAEFMFGIEDVYADVITTDLESIDEMIYDNKDDKLVEMYLRQELGDIKTADVTISEKTNKMQEVAIGLRWSEKFARNSVRMDAIDRWRMQVAIACRNALRNSGLRIIATDGSPTTKSLTGKTQANLLKIDLEFMDVNTLAEFNTPTATENVTQTIVPNRGQRNLLSFMSPNTDIGVTKENVFMAATDNKILNYVTMLGLNLYVLNENFMTEVSYNPDNKSYKATVTFEFCQVFIDRNARIVWTVT